MDGDVCMCIVEWYELNVVVYKNYLCQFVLSVLAESLQEK